MRDCLSAPFNIPPWTCRLPSDDATAVFTTKGSGFDTTIAVYVVHSVYLTKAHCVVKRTDVQ